MKLRNALIVIAGLGLYCLYLLLTVNLGAIGMIAPFVAVAGVLWLWFAPFSLYLWLIVSWPVLDLYARLKVGGLPELVYSRVVVGLLVLVVLAKKLAWRRGLQKLGWPVVAYLAVECLEYTSSYLTGGRPPPQWVELRQEVFVPIAMYWLARSFLTSRREIQALVAAAVTACVVICLTGLYERVLDLQESAFPIAALDELGNTRYTDVPGGRAAGVMANPGIYGGMMGMGFLATVCWLAYNDRTRVRLAAGAIAALLLYGVFVSYTRSAWMAALVACILVQWFVRGMWKVVTPLLLVAGLLLVCQRSAWEQSDVMKTRVLDDANIVVRADTIAFGWNLFCEHPILGICPGALNEIQRRAFGASWSSHNTFMTMLVDGGVLLLAPFLLLVFRWLTMAAAVIKSTHRDQFEHGLVATMAGWIVIWLLLGTALELSYFCYFLAYFWIAGATIESLADTCQVHPSETGLQTT